MNCTAMCSAKSVGVLWAAGDEEKECIEPVVISHGHGSGFTSEFVWDGCRDYAPALSLCTAIDFIQAHGVEQTRRYCHELLCEAATLLHAAWGTGGIVAGDDEGRGGDFFVGEGEGGGRVMYTV